MRASQSVNGDLRRGDALGTLTQRLDELHAGICGDETPDKKYASGLSNANKVSYLCRVLAYPPEVFSIEIDFPVDEWIASDDIALQMCGLYLNDLRNQYYTQVSAQEPDQKDTIWKRQSEAEFWEHAFNAMAHRRSTGMLIEDYRKAVH